MRPDVLRVGALACALTALSACVHRPDNGVGLQNEQTRVAFGANAPKSPAAAVPVPGLSRAERAAIAPAAFDDKAYLSKLPPIEAGGGRCSNAPVGAAAPESAGLSAKGTPAPGLYRWKISGTRQITTPPLKFPIHSFEKRLLRNVRHVNAGDFTYQIAEPDPSNDKQVLVRTFLVRTKANNQMTPAGVRTGDPDRGLALQKIERFDAKTGQLVATFAPSPAVLLLPLPVLPGEQFQGVGVDPRSLQSLTYNGQVIRRQRVDACGDIVDGWFVKGTQTFSGGSAQPYDIIVATQLGAMPIQEHTTAQTPQSSDDATFSLGQAKPSPAPSGSSG